MTGIRSAHVVLTVHSTVTDSTIASVSIRLIKTGSAVHTRIRKTNAPLFTSYPFVANGTSTFVSSSISFCTGCSVLAGIRKTQVDLFAVFSLETFSARTLESFTFIYPRASASISARIWMTLVLLLTVLSSESFCACALVTLSNVITSAAIFAGTGLTLTPEFTVCSHKSWRTGAFVPMSHHSACPSILARCWFTRGMSWMVVNYNSVDMRMWKV